MRANTNLRIAMRVADAAESRDVIEAPDAAAIPAGAARAAPSRMGERRADGRPELVTFQSAYPGGRSRASAGGTVRVVEHALRAAPGEAARQLSVIGVARPTDLQAIVGRRRRGGRRARAGAAGPAVAAAAAAAARPRAPCPTRARRSSACATSRRGSAQDPFAVDLDADGGLLVYGASGSGQDDAPALARRRPGAPAGPEDLHLYALDYASGGLRALERLPSAAR